MKLAYFNDIVNLMKRFIIENKFQILILIIFYFMYFRFFKVDFR
jgi:hypothetical protein